MLLVMAQSSPEALLDQRDKNGCSSTHWAAYKGDLVCLRLLRYFDADMAAKDNMKYTPLHRAAQRSQAKVASLLLEWGVDANERNDEKKTAFRIAEDAKDFATARILGRHTDVKDEEQENVV